MQINREPFLLPMGKQGWGLLVWGAWGVRMCRTAWKRQPFKWPHLCIQRRHWTTCYLPPPSPSSCCVPLLCLSKFLLSFHPFLLFFFFLLDDKDSSSTGSQGSSWPCESAPVWPASLITAQWLESLFCLQLQICKCYCIHVQTKHERLLLDRSFIILL